MKFVDVRIDGFGVWTGLTLADLSPGCTVFYGPNEAGKTTLLQFIRAVLYGFSPTRTARYLPPLSGVPAGGSLTVNVPNEGRLQITRQASPDQPLGSVLVHAADGTVQGATHLHRLLQDVDETTFQNIFAVGLHELQELGTLTDSEAARWLYDLSLGINRVSLSEVLTELEHSQLRLWSDQPSSQIAQLLTQREHLAGELADLANSPQRLEQLFAERTAADAQLAQLEAELVQQESKHRTWETAAALYDPWQRRRTLNARIEALGPSAQWPVDALERMNRLSAAVRHNRRKQRFIARRRKSLSNKLAQIKLNEPLWRQSARIEALSENESWIASLEQEIRQAEDNVKRLNADQQTHQQRLIGTANTAASQSAGKPTVWPQQIDHRTWRALRGPAAAYTDAKRQATADHQNTLQQHTALQSNRRDIDQALASLGQKNLGAALETAGQRVTQLRRRVQLDEKLDQLAHTKADLEHAITGHLQQQILPVWMIFAIGGIFVLGIVLTLAGLLLPASFTGSLGWPMVCLGLLGAGSAVAAKFMMERSAASQLEASRRQLTLVESQTQQAETDRDELDRTLPKAAGTFAARLQTAQQELAKLEELLPLEAQRQAADQAAQEIETRRANSQQNHDQALENWQSALIEAGLPEDLKPQQVRAIYLAGEQLGASQRQLADAQADLDRRRRELAAFVSRMEQVFLAAETLPQSSSIAEQLRQLRRELAEQETHQNQRHTIRQRRRRLKRHGASLSQGLRRLRRRRHQLLQSCQVPNLGEFRRRAAEFAQIATLITQRNAAAGEIASLLETAPGEYGSHYDSFAPATADNVSTGKESIYAALVSSTTPDQLAAQLATSRQRLEEIRREQQRLFEQRGQRNEQIRLLSTDRRPAVKRFQLAQIEQQLTAALNRWRVLTLTHRWLQLIKEHYERHRQPETLRLASEYLSQLTMGRYRRVWTRWDENALLVDDYESHTLHVEVLSQGTREQLFLGLRLALVELFARRGVALPIILDDVLVNFDVDRSAAAVQVLRSFSQRGHQLLVFTCHEHLARLFKINRFDVRRLPSNHQAGRDEPFVLESDPQPRRSRPRRVKEEAEPSPTVPLNSVVTAITSGPAISVEITPISPLEVVPVEAILPLFPPIVEPVAPAEPPLQVRVDLPQRTVRLSPIMRRWAAEEFSGELDDRVNPLWLMNGTVWKMAAPTIQPVESLFDSPRHTAVTVGQANTIRYVPDQSSPNFVDQPLGDDGLES